VKEELRGVEWPPGRMRLFTEVGEEPYACIISIHFVGLSFKISIISHTERISPQIMSAFIKNDPLT